MKLSFKLITLLIGISLFACKNTNHQNKNFKIEDNTPDQGDANEIVEYNNLLVGFTDKNNDHLIRLDENLNLISKVLENPNSQFNFTSVITPFDIPGISISMLKPDIPPTVLSNTDQVYFKENVFGLTTTLNKINETYSSLDNYIKAEDFKNDNGKAGKLLIDSIYTLCEKYYSYNDRILNKLKNIGDDAERVVLKSHPLKEYIFALKNDRKAVEDFNKLIVESENYKIITPKVKSAYQVLEAQNKKHAAMVAPDTKKYPGRASSFEKFNDRFNEYLIEARRVMRTNASFKGKITQSDINNLSRKQDYIREAYNSFVN